MRHLLVGIDGSQADLAVVEAARDLCAGRAGADVTLLHVIEPRTVDERRAWLERPQNGDDVDAATARHVRDTYAHLLDILVAAGVSGRIEVRRGIPGEAICRLARGGAYDLIVLGRRGLGRLEQLLLGSVSEAVIRAAHLPVLIVQ